MNRPEEALQPLERALDLDATNTGARRILVRALSDAVVEFALILPMFLLVVFSAMPPPLPVRPACIRAPPAPTPR